MKKIGLKWRGPLLSPSGYGTANRDYLQALHNHSNFDVIAEPRQMDTVPSSMFGEQGKLVKELSNKELNYDFIAHHHVPYAHHIRTERNIINIAYNTWETDKLPTEWVKNINKNFDLQLVPSEFNKEVYRNSGVQIPIEVLPHCVGVQEFIDADDNPWHLTDHEDKFKFLSVFQWTERKNPVGLLKAYFSEFYNRDDVILILKTYASGTTKEHKEEIKNRINELKHDMKLNHYPPIYFIGDMLSRSEMVSLYNACDCFVLPTRAEGFGIPFAESLAGRNFVIAPNYSGHVDFLKPVNEKCAFLTNYQMTPVAHMTWIPNYDASMNWSEPDIKETGFFMSHVCDAIDKNSLRNRKQMAREHVQKTLSPEVIAKKFENIIERNF